MLVIFFGAIVPMDAAWAVADIAMGLMTIINLPCCFVLFGVVGKTLDNYERQRKEGKNPEFHAKDIGLENAGLSCWD